MVFLFWSLSLLVFMTYFGYPLLLAAASLVTGNSYRKEDVTPSVSVIISVYNEEKSIEKKIEDTLKLNYPPDRLEVIVGSDGSTDGTNNIISRFKRAGVKAVFSQARIGKTAVQNLSVSQATGEILVFSDATTVYSRDIIRKLVRNFADPRVGAVGGELVYVDSKNSAVEKGTGAYWNYEKYMKKKESRLNSLIGVSGCCYAVRKDLYEPIDPELISDFVIALMIYSKGKKVIYEPEAVSFEEANTMQANEFNMRVRVAVRTLNGLRSMRRVLNPFRYGLFSVQLVFHKVLRYLVPLFLLALFLANTALLATGNIFFKLTFGFFVLFYSLALAGFAAASTRMGRLISIPYYYCLTNFALMAALIKFLKGEKKVTWEPERKAGEGNLNMTDTGAGTG